jgi:hypothetical protein
VNVSATEVIVSVEMRVAPGEWAEEEMEGVNVDRSVTFVKWNWSAKSNWFPVPDLWTVRRDRRNGGWEQSTRAGFDAQHRGLLPPPEPVFKALQAARIKALRDAL